MTETRSEYRKKQAKEKNKHFFKQIKSAFSDDDLDVNPEFLRDQTIERRPLADDDKENFESDSTTKPILSSEEKAERLKKKLNHAIILVIVLIILVLFALFHL